MENQYHNLDTAYHGKLHGLINESDSITNVVIACIMFGVPLAIIFAGIYTLFK